MSEQFVWSLLGGGTQEDPWKITSEDDMLEVKRNLAVNNDYQGKFFCIMQDITLGITEPWGGLGMAAIKDNKKTHSPYATKAGIGFAGTLDGGGHVVTVHRTADNVSGVGGLVNYLAPSGVVKNVTMVGTLTVTGNNLDAVGGVVGYNSGTIQNVTNQVVVTAIGAYNVGGIAGFNNGFYNLDGVQAGSNDENKPKGEVEHCMNHASIMGYAKVGGITGEDSGIIDVCANIADNIYGENASKDGVGGIAGRNGDNDAGVEIGKIENCYNTGTIQDQQGSWIGGITGFQDSESFCKNCYSIGKVVGYSYFDNIAGDNENKTPVEVEADGEKEKWTEGVFNSYGPLSSYIDTGAQHYDGAVLLSEEEMKTALARRLNGNAATGVWEPSEGQLPSLENCGNKLVPINPDSFVINVISNPNALTYISGEHFELYGLIIQAVYESGKRQTIDLTGVVEFPTEDLTEKTHKVQVDGSYQGTSFNFDFEVKVMDKPTGDVILGDGEAGYWATLQGAIGAAKTARDTVIYVANTIALGSGTYQGGSVTIKRFPGDEDKEAFENVMFTISTAANYDTEAYHPDAASASSPAGSKQDDNVTLEDMTLQGTIGAASAPMIRVDSGTLTLGSTVTIEDNQIPDTSGGSEDSSGSSTKEGSWSGFKNDAQRGAGISLHGGTVQCAGVVNNCETLEGGAFSVSDGKLILTGSITGCTGANGSAIYQQGGKVTVSGTISSCTADKKGTILVTCGDRDTASEFIVDGGTISGNKAAEGSILYIEGGKAAIQGNSTLSGKAAGVYVANQYIMKKGRLDKTVIGLLTMTDGTLTREQESRGNPRVTDSDTRALVVIDGGEVKLNGGTVNDRICVENELVVTDEETGAQELVRGRLYLSGGTIGGDAEDVAVNINGGECVMIGGEVDGSEAPITSSSQAVCVDCVSIKMKEAQGDTAETVTKTIKGKFTMHDGTISGGKASAAVNINGGEVTMEDGTINHGSSYGVRVSSMTITDSQTKATETVVGTFVMNGGEIHGGTNAPAVVACGGEFTLVGGKVSNEEEGGYAIRVNSSSGSKFTLAGNAIIVGDIYVEIGAHINLDVVLTKRIDIIVPEGFRGTIVKCANGQIAYESANKIYVNGKQCAFNSSTDIVI